MQCSSNTNVVALESTPLMSMDIELSKFSHLALENGMT